MAKQLEQNQLLPEILKQREQDLVEMWRNAGDKEQRESAWHALRQLDLLAGAIEDGIRTAISGS